MHTHTHTITHITHKEQRMRLFCLLLDESVSKVTVGKSAGICFTEDIVSIVGHHVVHAVANEVRG